MNACAVDLDTISDEADIVVDVQSEAQGWSEWGQLDRDAPARSMPKLATLSDIATPIRAYRQRAHATDHQKQGLSQPSLQDTVEAI